MIKLIVTLLIGYSVQSATILGGAGANRFVVASGGGPSVAPTYVSSSDNAVTLTTTCAVTITVSGADSNRGLLIAIGQGNSGGTPKTINSVSWSGSGTPQTATAITGFASNDGNFCAIAGYYLVAPTAETSGTLTVTFATAPSTAWVGVSYYKGMAQTSIFGTAVTGSSTLTTTSTVTVTGGTGKMNWAAVSTDADGAITIGGTASPTSRIEREGVVSDMGFSIGDATASGTITWTWTGADNGWATAAIPVNGL